MCETLYFLFLFVLLLDQVGLALCDCTRGGMVRWIEGMSSMTKEAVPQDTERLQCYCRIWGKLQQAPWYSFKKCSLLLQWKFCRRCTALLQSQKPVLRVLAKQHAFVP